MKDCQICNAVVLNSGWCPSCAKDTCAECWSDHVPKCFNEYGHRCHHCDKRIRNVADINDMEGIIVQRFTGRTFCDSICFDAYCKNESGI